MMMSGVVTLLVAQVASSSAALELTAAPVAVEVRGGYPFAGMATRWRPAPWVELAGALELVDGDAALRAMAAAAAFPLRSRAWAVGAEVGVGRAFGLRARSTGEAELGLVVRAAPLAEVEVEAKAGLLGILGPVATHTSLVGQVRGRVSYRVLSWLWVGVEGGALLGWSSQVPVAGLVCSAPLLEAPDP